MLYRHLGDGEDLNLINDPFTQDENELRHSLFEQATSQLEFDEEFYFNKEYGIANLQEVLNALNISLYGTIDEVINIYEKVWSDKIIKIKED